MHPAASTVAGMCGRYVSTTSVDDIAAYFDADRIDESLLAADTEGPPNGAAKPSWNVAPTVQVPVVMQTAAGDTEPSERLVRPCVWGLIPFWAKEAKIGARMINARAETVATKPAFKQSFARRRCIIPADAFYEWTATEAKLKKDRVKQPWHIARSDGSLLAFAGIYDHWKGPDPKDDPGGPPRERTMSCSIITTEANVAMQPVHDRMPVLLAATDWDLWLEADYGRTGEGLDHLGSMLKPAPNDLLTFRPVGTEVNNARNNSVELLSPLPDEIVQNLRDSVGL